MMFSQNLFLNVELLFTYSAHSLTWHLGVVIIIDCIW